MKKQEKLEETRRVSLSKTGLTALQKSVLTVETPSMEKN
jgi:hypothetical protein